MRPVDHVENNVERSFGRTDIAGTQPGIQHVAGLGHRGDQRMIDAAVIMAIPFGFGLMTMDVDGHAVDVEREPFGTPAAPFRPGAAGPELQNRLTQHRSVGGRGHDGGKARERGLRRQAACPHQRRLPDGRADGQPQGRVVPKGIRIIMIAPTPALQAGHWCG